jgi:hypothetical protein
MDRYMGVDAHASSCTLAVVSGSGKRICTQVVETNVRCLIEAGGFGLGQVAGGRLVEVEAGICVEREVVLRRSARGGVGRRGGGQAEVCEDGARGFRGGDEGEDAHVAAAVAAGERETS